jgi:hypothetical protein
VPLQGAALIATAAFLLLRKKNKKRRESQAFAGLDIFSPSNHNEKFPPTNDSGNLGGDPAIMGAAAAGGTGAGAAAAQHGRRASGADGDGGLWAGVATGVGAAGAAGAGGRRKSGRNQPAVEEEDEGGAFGGGRIDPCTPPPTLLSGRSC